MGTFSGFWARSVRRRPELANDEAVVTITVANLKKVLDGAYQAGHRDGVEMMGTLTAAKEAVGPTIFDKLFG